MAAARFCISVSAEPVDPAGALDAFAAQCPDAGAIVTFTGQVRDEGGAVTELTLEHYPGLTDRAIAAAMETARARWRLIGAHVVHRVGAMAPGEAIVFVAAAAKHRRDAFEAADFLMDFLKTSAPFWKNETSKNEKRWISPTADDFADAARWRTEEVT